jgi:hypothetical protein
MYFAIQASYERQLVTANQQALNAEVREFNASYSQGDQQAPHLAADDVGHPKHAGSAGQSRRARPVRRPSSRPART